jgi:energy-coupling factor transport system permease protein
VRVTLAPAAGSRLGAINPSAKLVAATIVLVGLLATVDVVSAGFVLACEVVALVPAGVRTRVLLRRGWPLLVGAAGVALANHLSGAPAGEVAAISLRLPAMALPGVLVFASTEPVDLTDSLVQQLRVPRRFAYGALAAFRLLPLVADDWRIIGRARRARGIGSEGSPLKAVRLWGSMVFALLVASIRRGTRLAAAMDSRGFDASGPRTHARRQVLARRDVMVVVAVAAATVGADLLAVALGTWHPLLS